jgi:hypothetical protein
VPLRFDPETGGWIFPFGDTWRTLVDPDGPPSGRQLLRLARLRLLEIRNTPGRPVTKRDCSTAIDREDAAA